MKKILFTICITLISNYTIQAQTKNENIKAIYLTEFIISENLVENLPAAYKEAVKAEIKNGVFVNFELESNGKLSSFKPEIKVNNTQSNGGLVYQQIIASEGNPLYKDYTENKFYNVKEVGGKAFLIQDKLTDYQWKITREKASISGYNVTKAIGTDKNLQDLIVWFSTELPYRDGPYRFANLPGLIVKAEFSTPEFKTIFTLKDVQILDKPINVKLPTKGKIITDEQFINEMKELNKKYKNINQGVDTSK